MKKILHLSIFILLGAVFYCVLTESFDMKNLFIGFAVALLGAIIFNKGIEIKFSPKKVLRYIRYIIYLIYNIFFQSVKVVINLFKKKEISIDEEAFKEDISYVAIANAITLSPGTVTLEKDGGVLTILSFIEKEKK